MYSRVAVKGWRGCQDLFNQVVGFLKRLITGTGDKLSQTGCHKPDKNIRIDK